MKKKASQKPNPALNILQEAYHSFLTHEEEKINENSQKHTENEKVRLSFVEKNEVDEEDDEDYEFEFSELDIAALKKENKADKIAEIALHLIFKKKITPENAFEIPIFNISELSSFQKYSKSFDWKNCSFALEAEAQIYGHRVDLLHSNTHKIIGSLIRSYFENNNVENLNQNSDDFDRVPLKAPQALKGLESNDKHLEKNISNLDTVKYDLEFDIDPLFRKTSAKFDESAAKGLLLNNLCVNQNLKIDFSSFQQEFPLENMREKLKNVQKSIVINRKYESLENFDCEFGFSKKELNQKQICDNMEEIVKDMTVQLENLETLADRTLENIENEPIFEDIYYMNEENQEPQNTVFFEETKKKTCSTKKKAIEEEPLVLDKIEEKNKMIGNGCDWNEPEPEPIKEEEISGNKKRRIRKESIKTKTPIDFNMKEKESIHSIFQGDKTKKKERGTNYDEYPIKKDLFLIPLDLEMNEERFHKTFLRDFRNVIQKNTAEMQEENEANQEEVNEGVIYKEEQAEEEEFEENNELIEKNITKLSDKGKAVRMKNISFSSYISMKQLKDKLNKCIKTYQEQHIQEPLTFSTLVQSVYSKLSKAQRSLVSMHICFVSLLHLAAENFLTLKQIDSNDFLIIPQ